MIAREASSRVTADTEVIGYHLPLDLASQPLIGWRIEEGPRTGTVPSRGRMLYTIRTIARREFIGAWRDGRFRIAAVLVLVLAAAALVGGWQHASRIAAEHEVARQATRAQWVNQPAKNPHSAAHYGIYAFRPQTPLAAVDTGVDPYVGVAAWLEAHRQNEFRFRPAADRASVQRVADLNGAFVLQVLLPLLVVILGFAAIAGERESGTLRQLVGTGVSPTALVAGKLAGLSAVLALILAPTIALGALAISWSSMSAVWESDGVRTAWLMGLYLAWAGLWTGVTVMVSAVARTARVALVVLLAIWMASALVAPRVVLEVASRLHPTPSATAFERALDADLADRTEVDRRVDERRRALFAQYGVSRQEDLPVGFSGIALQESEEHANVVFDRHYGPLYDTFERQNRFAQWVGLLVPSLAVRSLSMGLSGSDFSHHRHFASAAETYRRDLQRALNRDIVEHQRAGQAYLADAALWSSVPDFEYQAPGVGWVVAAQRPALMAVVAWGVILAGSLMVAVRRLGTVA